MRKPEGPADLNADTWAGCDNLWVFADFLLAPPAGVYPADATDESLDRRLRLLLVAALRAVWHHLPDPRSRAAVEASERYADDRDSSAVDAAWGPAEAAMEEADEAAIANGDASNVVPRTTAAAWDCLDPDLIDDRKFPFWVRVLEGLARRPDYPDRSAAGGQALHLTLFRDLFGNPFRPVARDPAWLTSTVVQLAQGIYTGRAFDGMPILADALQDAGCESEDVLDHCRRPGPHPRGCWVVDLLLGKS